LAETWYSELSGRLKSIITRAGARRGEDNANIEDIGAGYVEIVGIRTTDGESRASAHLKSIEWLREEMSEAGIDGEPEREIV